MAVFELIMPKLGESIIEVTILKWNKNIGDKIEAEESVLEIATDKVDSEVPSPVNGVLSKIFFQVDDVVPIGTVVAHIQTNDGSETVESTQKVSSSTAEADESQPTESHATPPYVPSVEKPVEHSTDVNGEDRFYSPLVRNIAQAEHISRQELDTIPGSGQGGRLTKQDLMAYISNRSKTKTPTVQEKEIVQPTEEKSTPSQVFVSDIKSGPNTEIIEMDRMRKLIADHMVKSKQTSPHVTSFVEADVTNIVCWRDKNKNAFQQKYGQKLTYTPIFIEAIVKAIRDFPMINVSVEGDKIIVKKNINIGMAAALPSGNLIVPVIKNADRMNLVGLAGVVNDLAERARKNALRPDEIQDGTYTVTNVGTFGNDMGTPIINQPQVAIMALGAIRKKPAVIETEEYGDIIAVRHMMILSHAYDHRVVDGFLGGSFVKRVAEYLESFDPNAAI